MTTLTESAQGLRDPQAEALTVLEQLARQGYGPSFTQRSLGIGYTHMTTGGTTEDFCHAIIAIGKMATKGNRNDEKNSSGKQ